MYVAIALKNRYANITNTKRYLYGGFWILIAFLEFAQDYISSLLHGGQFQLLESLAYKLFWLLFIPATFLFIYGLDTSKLAPRIRFNTVVRSIFQVVVISILHLIIFSLLLFGISKLIHDSDPWQLSWLLTEKLSSRLYIALSIYLAIAIVYFWLRQNIAKKPERFSKTVVVKNGRKSVVVHVDSIKWISSEGPYLFLHTANQKHIISDSLKNFIGTLPENFKRIHRSTIVNIDMVKELKSRMNGDYDVILNDTQKLRLSRNYSKPLKGTLL